MLGNIRKPNYKAKGSSTELNSHETSTAPVLKRGQEVKGNEHPVVKRPRIAPENKFVVGVGYDSFSMLKKKSNEPIEKIYIGTCSFNYRYHQDNNPHSALKYDPVTVGTKKNMEYYEKAYHVIQKIRQQRCPKHVKFIFKVAILAGCTNYTRKVMVVPSVGCPASLTNSPLVGNLLWAARARERPTVLIVHASELDLYFTNLQEILEHYGVGLVSWETDQKVKGFGISRLAAQQLAYRLGPSAAVLCDIGVHNSQDVADGYESYDDEDEKGIKIRNLYPKGFSFKGTGFYGGAGFGSGNPMLDWEDQKLVRTKGQQGGKNRPIEQVVIVSDEMLFDPCFITSSEDMDLSNQLIFEEQLLQENNKKLEFSDFKYCPEENGCEISKIIMGGKSLTQDKYMNERNKYLEEDLAEEDELEIDYSQNKKIKRTTVGELAAEIAGRHKLNPVVIRSLIIEKILLAFKENHRQKLFDDCAEYQQKLREQSQSEDEFWQAVVKDQGNKNKLKNYTES